MQVSFGNRAVLETNNCQTADKIIEAAKSQPELYHYDLSTNGLTKNRFPYKILLCDDIDKTAIEQLKKGAREFSKNVTKDRPSDVPNRIAEAAESLYRAVLDLIKKTADGALTKNIDELPQIDSNAIKSVLKQLFTSIK